MRNKILIGIAVFGILLGVGSAFFMKLRPKSEPPAFKPASNPYRSGIYANGIIESAQKNGSNVNIYPEVSGTVLKILAHEGQQVKAGEPLLMLDDAVQRSTAESAKASIAVAEASVANVQAQYAKLKASWNLDPRSVSKDALDTAANAVRSAKANLELARKQYDAARALLGKYTLTAREDGTVLAINTSVGSYISSQGGYNSYTGGYVPVIVMGNSDNSLQVRCYVDEILIQRLPDPVRMSASMSIRGTTLKIPLKFERFQPDVTPKIELSSQRTERVDVRVLPVIFSFVKPKNVTLYPGQLVDIYIGEQAANNK
ncbi:biotin/lipoyl-binding protein [Chlorobaculum sp. MV4-Y]|jgi:HlyD family secretion protein|uniref:efflux RND transporter periplasmic adaptor subunit n=1 Tax=Chlorobaculum sp. MV4-Y TaxID=2976335 RepID=UPI0021AEE568|nr:biotin/lipoyl-binding protein [Chlorobaculum sp. MV4-Y]UWX57073.1 biotin/lipoyl-binding protein [Chlorobaculum sp. MV4-Y]